MSNHSIHQARLTVHTAKKFKYDVELWGGISWTIGRHPSCRITLEDRFVSRFHAVINSAMFQHQYIYFVIDNNTVNGTLLNGNQLVYPTLLHDQDVLVMGTTVLAFHHPTMFKTQDPEVLKELQKLARISSKSISWLG